MPCSTMKCLELNFFKNDKERKEECKVVPTVLDSSSSQHILQRFFKSGSYQLFFFDY